MQVLGYTTGMLTVLQMHKNLCMVLMVNTIENDISPTQKGHYALRATIAMFLISGPVVPSPYSPSEEFNPQSLTPLL